MTVLKGELAVRQSIALVRTFKRMKDYILENRDLIGQREILQLSMETANNRMEINKINSDMISLEKQILDVAEGLKDVVTKSELANMMNSFVSDDDEKWLMFNAKFSSADEVYESIYKQAKSSIYVVDNYIGLRTLVHLKNSPTGVNITLFSDNVGNNKLHNIEFTDFCKEYPSVKISMKKTGGIIDNPVYMGKIAYGRRRTEKKTGTRNETHVVEQSDFPVYEGIHEAIISEEDWDLAQEKRSKNNYKREKIHDPEHAHILSGILKCPCCGKGMYGNIAKAGRKDNKTRYYYYCKNTVNATGHKCTFRRNIEQSQIDDMLAKLITAMTKEGKFKDAIQDKIGATVDTTDLEKQLSVLNASLHQAETIKTRLEQQMDNRGPLGIAAGADGSQHRGDTGADVLTEQDEYRAVQADHAAERQGLQDPHRGGGGLDDRGEARAHQNTDQRIGERAHQFYKGRPVPQRLHGRAHHVHADEKHAQAGQDAAVVADLGLFHEDHHRYAHKRKQRRQNAHIQRDELPGDGGADVGPHDDPYGLTQGHHTGVDKAHYHDGGGGGGLDDRRDDGAHQNAQKPVGRQPLQDALHPVAGSGLQAGAHHLHAV